MPVNEDAFRDALRVLADCGAVMHIGQHDDGTFSIITNILPKSQAVCIGFLEDALSALRGVGFSQGSKEPS